MCYAVINDAYWKSLLYLFEVKLALCLMEHPLGFLEVKMLSRKMNELPSQKKTLPHSCIPGIEQCKQQNVKANFSEKIFYALSLHMHMSWFQLG